MKRVFLFAGVVLVLSFALLTWRLRPQAKQPGDGAVVTADTAMPVIGVEALMHDVDRYRGTLQVEGAVSAASAETQTLALIDTKELERCGVTTCAPLSLPVRWTGTLPAVGQLVRIEGSVSESDGKLVFIAQTLDPVERTDMP